MESAYRGITNRVKNVFIAIFNFVAQAINRNAVDHGWWDVPREAGTIMALIHSEVSEALEALRQGNPESDKIQGFSSLEEELADIIIRVMDFAAMNGLRLPEAILAKHEFNVTRPYRHGKEF